MEKVRELVWNGALNVQFIAKSNILIDGIPENKGIVNLRIPRDTYIINYLPLVLSRIRNVLKINIDDYTGQFWFEFKDTSIPWHYPMGVIYDVVEPEYLRNSAPANDDTTLNMWKLHLNYGPNIPHNLLPLIDGINQVEKYWMHLWKQACFILNGSSKQVMSVSMKDSQIFWNSVLLRRLDNFEHIARRIVPIKPRFVPLIVHRGLSFGEVNQPTIMTHKDDGSACKILDIFVNLSLERKSSDIFICQGIQIPLDMDLTAVYNNFMSFDGFLHLVLISETHSTKES
ncbi:hypothetical protein NCAS_0C01650 [Naumovozyma castellii]|uniref:Autophagy protein 5 n=1 Tax=Naumovozyma castellii TaxID=27288 RepID=G0VCE6_NAUCA|nr:hypothetical protein NCAS_0C01650 [Naumovozyma castellii CBS 4309]CCC69155.1 hypothetical protein NCAS_0C01650 [Naumovozyma castellii CBS 4309]